MSEGDKLMLKSMAVGVGIFILAGSGGRAWAANEAARPFPDHAVPTDIARKHALSGRPLVVGDLKPASEVDVDTLLDRASADRSMFERCIEIGAGVLQWSEDGSTLELAPPWGYAAVTKISTAFCDDGIVWLGGARQELPESESVTWLFYWSQKPGQRYGPYSLLAQRVYPVGIQGAPFKLTELLAIDPISRRLLFSATTADGREVPLAANFAILPRR